MWLVKNQIILVFYLPISWFVVSEKSGHSTGGIGHAKNSGIYLLIWIIQSLFKTYCRIYTYAITSKSHYHRRLLIITYVLLIFFFSSHVQYCLLTFRGWSEVKRKSRSLQYSIYFLSSEIVNVEYKSEGSL